MLSMSTGGGGLRLSRIGALALVVLLAGACDDESPLGPDPSVFEGEVAGVDPFEDLSGDITLEVGTEALQIALALSDFPEPGDGFPWILRDGTCAVPGDEIGALEDYPLIEPDDDGEWTDVVEIEADDEADAYVIEIRRSEDEEDTVIACGELDRS